MKQHKLSPYKYLRKVDEHNVYYIETQDDLHEVVRRLKDADEIAIDLEFDRNRHHYGFTLCLLQIAYDNNCYLIDPLSDCSNHIDTKTLAPLWEVLANPKIIKILHSPSEDVRLLKLSGCEICNIFDTDIAVKLTLRPATSYKDLLEKRLGIILEKDQQTSDWYKRPLTPFQLQYAAKDVLYLAEIKKQLIAELAQLGRMEWFNEEMLLLERLEETDFEEPHLRIKGAKQLSDAEQHVLKALYAYREEHAKLLNKPPFQVIDNYVLFELIADPQTTLLNWATMRGKHPKLKNDKTAQFLQQLIENAQEEARQLPKTYYRPTQEERIASYKRREALIQCREIFKPLRDHLQTQFGEAASLVFTTKLVDELCTGKRKIDELKKYTQPLIRAAAQELGIDISPYE